jgi:hypothetical protein
MLPPYSHCPLEFLHCIVDDTKLVFKQSQVKHLEIPRWPELGVKKVWPEALKLPSFIDYVPDEYLRPNYPVPRGYFYNILTTLALDFVEFLISDCRNQRIELKMANAQKMKQVKKNYTKVSKTWKELLTKEKFFSGKSILF